MANISKIAFLRTLWFLKDYLADIVIGGGWAPLIYYHYLLGDKTKNPVRTFDIDLMVKNTVPVRGERSLDQLLTDAGLSTEFKSVDIPPIIHYEGVIENCDVEIEFLTDQKDSKPDVVIEVQRGLHAEALRYISVATDNTISVTIDDFEDQVISAPFQVKVPSPSAYIFHKGLVFKRRKEKAKKAKDLFLSEFSPGGNALRNMMMTSNVRVMTLWEIKGLMRMAPNFSNHRMSLANKLNYW